MKMKYEFAISEVAGETVAIAVDAGSRNMVISLNSTAQFLFSLLTKGTDEAAMTAALLENYEGLDEATAREDVEQFVQILREKELLED